MPHRAAWSVRLCVILLTIGIAVQDAAGTDRAGGLRKLPTLPAEFERQDALLVSWSADDEGVEEALTAIVAAVHRNVHVIVLTPDDECLRGAMRCFSLAGVPQTAVRYVRAKVDTIWTRDYGPSSIRAADGTMTMIDADYETGTRARDDQLAGAIAPLLGLPSVHVPLTVEGGNLLSNGRGLGIATIKLRDANAGRGYSEPQLRELLHEVYGFSQVVFLEPLIGEPTGHVDMFATFVSPSVVVVGRYDRESEPVNADLLDRNARRLAAVQTPWGRLRVVRVPMPPSGPNVWRTYTNVLYANGTLLVPSYPGVTAELEHEAVEVMQQLLPAWRIVPVDCNQLIALGGGVHCVTLNVPRVGRLPRAVDPRELFEPGGAFPGEEAAPHGLIVDRAGWQPTGGDRERPPAIEHAVVVSAVDEFDIADECGVCCPAPKDRTLTNRSNAESSPADQPGGELFATPAGHSPRGGVMFGHDTVAPPRRPEGAANDAADLVRPHDWRPARPRLGRAAPAALDADRRTAGGDDAEPAGFARPWRAASGAADGRIGPHDDLVHPRLAPGWRD
ncbi:MAG TPA: agmatine deiminase family protein [Planctomycetaceae bacterium]|nr:agmatine deiminase family protein [Planctomycetaceae bacterium]